MPQMIIRSKERAEGARNQSEPSVVAVPAWACPLLPIRLLSLCWCLVSQTAFRCKHIETPSENAIRERSTVAE